MPHSSLRLLLICFALLPAPYVMAQTYPQFVAVEGDTFLMGDSHAEGESNESPHKVFVKSFRLARTETTVAQWKAYVKAMNLKMPEAPSWGWTDSLPITGITWQEANDYCIWLSSRTGRICRLPTEAEWEFAARGGKLHQGRKYSGSDKLEDVAWYAAVSKGKIHPVARKQPNELGLFDMNGNAWEWCSDWYGVYDPKNMINPKGRSTGSERVLRGCDFNNDSTYCRLSNRNPQAPAYRHLAYGFRVAANY